MPTKSSRSAAAVAEELSVRGMATSAVQVQRWREAGLLGAWVQKHHHGRGSSAVAAPDAVDRALICGRLKKHDRVPALVTLLAWLYGAPVDIAEVGRALKQVVDEVFSKVIAPPGVDPYDHANAMVASEFSRPARAVEMRRQADRLKSVPSPLAASGLDDLPSELDRVHDLHAANMTVFVGESTEMPTLADAMYVDGLGDLAEAAGLSDPETVAEVGRELASITAPEFLTAATEIDARISPAALGAAREMFALWPPFAGHWAELRSGHGQIGDPLAMVGAALSLLLSELAFPGLLRDALVSAATEAGTAATLDA